MKQGLLILIALSMLSACVVDKGKVSVNVKKPTKSTIIQSNASVSSVKIVNHQLVITGTGLESVSDVKINGNSVNEIFSIESQSATKIIANSIHAFSFDVSKVFNLILSDAQASATFQIDFALCNATLNGKGFDCSPSTILHHNDVLSYDSGTQKWKPRAINNLSYIGLLDASGSMPAAGPAGQYYIISVGGNGFSEGDWAVSNGSTFDQINNATYVTKVFGRTGDVEPEPGDYSLDMLADVNIAPTAGDDGKVLKYNHGTGKWILALDNSGGGASSVTTSTIVNGAVTDAKIDTVSASKITGTINSTQILDGTIVNADIAAGAAIDYSKLNIPNTSIPYAKLNIADGDIPAAKISGLPSATVVLATSIVNGDTTHAPDGNAVFDALAVKLGTTGGTLTTGTINGVPTPVNPSDVVNKDYVDDQDALLLLKTGGTLSGLLSLDADLRIKGGATNYVTLKAHATTTAYDFVFPQTKGTNGYVLSTDGNGNTSWVAVTDSGVQTFAKTTLPTCNAGEVLKSNGSALSCVTDTTGAGAFSGTASRAVATGTGGALEVSATTATELSYVNGVTSSIQTQLNAKEGTITAGTTTQYYRGDKSWQTLDTSVVPEGSRLYFTDARAKSATVADAIVDAVLDVAPSQNAVFDALALKLSNTGGVMSVGTISGIPTPTNGDDVASKSYVDTKIDYSSGLGVLIPASARMLMKSCPTGWTENGVTPASGPPSVSCDGTNCKICENGSTASMIPSSSVVLMEFCPATWTPLGTNLGGPGAAGRLNGQAFTSCRSPASNSYVPENARFIMATCPATWKDLAPTGSSALGATCDGVSCRICEAPGPQISSHIMPNPGLATEVGRPLQLMGGAGGSTSGDGGIVYLMGGIPTDGKGGSVSIAAAAGAANGNGGDVFISSGAKAGTGSDGSVIINSNGRNVGIGTSTPKAVLDTSGGTVRVAGGANFGSYPTTGQGVEFGYDTTAAIGFISAFNRDTTAYKSLIIDGSSLALNAYSAGNVVIGASTTTHKFDVQGGDINTSGNVRAVAVVLSSDKRWKREIKPLENSLEKLKKLNGVSYVWAINEFPEKHFNDEKQIGVIAQDVQAVFPELVAKDQNGFLSVNYPGLIAPLIEAIKDQQKQIAKNLEMFEVMKFGIYKTLGEHAREIASIKKENAQLKKLTKELSEENAAIKAYLCSKDKSASICK